MNKQTFLDGVKFKALNTFFTTNKKLEKLKKEYFTKDNTKMDLDYMKRCSMKLMQYGDQVDSKYFDDTGKLLNKECVEVVRKSGISFKMDSNRLDEFLKIDRHDKRPAVPVCTDVCGEGYSFICTVDTGKACIEDRAQWIKKWNDSLMKMDKALSVHKTSNQGKSETPLCEHPCGVEYNIECDPAECANEKIIKRSQAMNRIQELKLPLTDCDFPMPKVKSPKEENQGFFTDGIIKRNYIKKPIEEVHRRLLDLDWFKSAMITKLMANSEKGDYKRQTDTELLSMLKKEVDELEEAIEKGNHGNIIYECADVANFAMFIASKYKTE